jgi:hypothetical protein
MEKQDQCAIARFKPALRMNGLYIYGEFAYFELMSEFRGLVFLDEQGLLTAISWWSLYM